MPASHRTREQRLLSRLRRRFRVVAQRGEHGARPLQHEQRAQEPCALGRCVLLYPGAHSPRLTPVVQRAAVLTCLVVALAGCGSTSYGPDGPPPTAGAADATTVGQDPSQQPDQGGLKTPAYTAAHNACSLYGLDELARQNGVKATRRRSPGSTATARRRRRGSGRPTRAALDAIKAG